MQKFAACAEIGAAGVNVIRTGIVILIANSICVAQPRYIGTASCPENFWVDSAGVSNHATLFENSTVETEGAPAKLQIGGDVRLLIDAHSRAQVDQKHLVLEKGRAQLDNGKDYRIEASSIRVSLAKPSARAIVSVGVSGVVEVAALGGMVHVENAEGVAVANVAAGRAVELRLGQTSEAAMLTGCIVKTGTTYVLRDEASAVTVELRGADIANDVGRRVQVSGTMAPSQHALAAADQVVQAKAVRVLGSGCGVAVESAAVTGSRARAATQPASTGAASTGEADGAGSTGGASTAGTGVTASTAGAAGAAGTAGAASAGIGVSTAVIAGVAVTAASGGTAAAIVATQSNKAPISPGR
jgi:hypothetical protein